MNQPIANDNQPIESGTVDARSTVKEFESYLIANRKLPAYPGAYAKDKHFTCYGFDFIQTKADIENFIRELEAAPRERLSRGCNKVWSIQSHLNYYQAESDEKLVSYFKHIAAVARRTHCGCHDVGCYARTKRPIYRY